MAIGPPWISFDSYAGHRWSFVADSREKKNLKLVWLWRWNDPLFMFSRPDPFLKIHSWLLWKFYYWIWNLWAFGVFQCGPIAIGIFRNRVESGKNLVHFQFCFDIFLKVWCPNWYRSHLSSDMPIQPFPNTFCFGIKLFKTKQIRFSCWLFPAD